MLTVSFPCSEVSDAFMIPPSASIAYYWRSSFPSHITYPAAPVSYPSSSDTWIHTLDHLLDNPLSYDVTTNDTHDSNGRPPSTYSALIQYCLILGMAFWFKGHVNVYIPPWFSCVSRRHWRFGSDLVLLHGNLVLFWVA